MANWWLGPVQGWMEAAWSTGAGGLGGGCSQPSHLQLSHQAVRQWGGLYGRTATIHSRHQHGARPGAAWVQACVATVITTNRGSQAAHHKPQALQPRHAGPWCGQVGICMSSAHSSPSSTIGREPCMPLAHSTGWKPQRGVPHLSALPSSLPTHHSFMSHLLSRCRPLHVLFHLPGILSCNFTPYMALTFRLFRGAFLIAPAKHPCCCISLGPAGFSPVTSHMSPFCSHYLRDS